MFFSAGGVSADDLIHILGIVMDVQKSRTVSVSEIGLCDRTEGRNAESNSLLCGTLAQFR